MTTFAELGVDQDIVETLAAKGIVDAFPIQEQTIPLGLPGQDIIGQAKTGTGKTFGFGIPVVQRLGLNPAHGVQPRATTRSPPARAASTRAPGILDRSPASDRGPRACG